MTLTKPAFRRGQYVDDANPADALVESEERAPDTTLADGLGRIICWILESDKPKNIGLRFLVLAYEIRPDLINGMTLREIADRCGCRKSFVWKLARQFRATFGLRGLNARPHARASLRAAWRKAHPVARHVLRTESHLDVVNRFAFWRSDLERYPEARPPDRVLLRDLAPLLSFLSDLERRVESFPDGSAPASPLPPDHPRVRNLFALEPGRGARNRHPLFREDPKTKNSTSRTGSGS